MTNDEQDEKLDRLLRRYRLAQSHQAEAGVFPHPTTTRDDRDRLVTFLTSEEGLHLIGEELAAVVEMEVALVKLQKQAKKIAQKRRGV